MHFVHSDLGHVTGGTVAVTTLGTAADVRLLDDPNFRSYEAGRSYRGHYMAYYRTSPVPMAVPTSGHWHVVIDLGGGAGTVNAGVRLLTP